MGYIPSGGMEASKAACSNAAEVTHACKALGTTRLTVLNVHMNRQRTLTTQTIPSNPLTLTMATF